jgi:hypothetical protein
MADFPNVVVSNGTGVTLEANICEITIGSGASNDAGVNYVYDFVDIIPTQTYNFTVDVQRLAGTTNARLEVKWRKPDGSGLSVVQGPTAPTTVGTKQTLTYSGAAPSGAGHAIVCVRYTTTPASGEKLRTSNPGVSNPSSPSLPTLIATVVEGDGSLTANWTPSDATRFSAYEARITDPAEAVTTSGPLPSTSLTFKFDGLTNGVDHTIQIDGTVA